MDHPSHLLAAHGLDPKKSLGQNFLHDDSILGAIVDAADVQPGDSVLEIGPGLGALTRHLANRARRVVAVELDQRFLPILAEQTAEFENVQVVHGDILAYTPQTWFGNDPYKVVANVPYYITGAILEHLLEGPAKPESIVLTVQKEVAERITAQPGDMTLLAVSVQVFGLPQIMRHIAAGAFWPRPDVDSSVLRIVLHDPPLIAPQKEKAFFRLVRVGFSQKRKQLQKNLRALGYDRAQTIALLQEAAIEPRRRAETLSIDEWLRLFATIGENQQVKDPD